MAFTFVHTADWQIGKPFGNVDPAAAGVLQEARFEAIERVGRAAAASGARHVVVAGDVYDAQNLPPGLVRRALSAMARFPAISWHLLPGNHDPARTGGFWYRLAAAGLPANVHPILEAAPVVMETGAVLLPAPLKSRTAGADPTAWMDAAATPEGTIRIGLAHGSVRRFSSTEESPVEIAPDRARRSGLSYLALGDWHGCVRINERTWYSGTPEQDRFMDNEAGFALVVRCEGAGADPHVERVRTGRFHWLKRAIVVRDAGDLDEIDRDIAACGARPEDILLRLELSGRLSLTRHQGVTRWIEELADRHLRHVEADLDRLLLAAGEDEALAELGPAGELGQAARRLMAIAADEGDPRSAVAAAALVRLSEFAALVRKEAE